MSNVRVAAQSSQAPIPSPATTPPANQKQKGNFPNKIELQNLALKDPNEERDITKQQEIKAQESLAKSLAAINFHRLKDMNS